jgi:hypothetical protein
MILERDFQGEKQSMQMISILLLTSTHSVDPKYRIIDVPPISRRNSPERSKCELSGSSATIEIRLAAKVEPVIKSTEAGIERSIEATNNSKRHDLQSGVISIQIRMLWPKSIHNWKSIQNQ